MSRFKSTRLNKHARPGNFLTRIDELNSRASDTFIRPVSADALDQISERTGTIIADALISPASGVETMEPTDSGFTGVAMGGDGWTFGSIIWHWVAVAAGVLQVGINYAGQFLAGAGAYVLDALGQTITGVDFLTKHNATYGSYNRMYRSGFQIDENGKLFYRNEYSDNATQTNLITSNPSFEDGDFTGYSASTDWAVISTDSPPDGTYQAYHAAGSGNPLTTDKYATSGAQYKFLATGRTTVNAAFVQAKWYNATPTLLRTDIVGYLVATPAKEISGVFRKPVGATQVEVNILPANSSAVVYVDNLKIEAVPEFAAQDFSDEGMFGWSDSHKVDYHHVFPFGNGMDGDVTISSNTTLAKDRYYNNLTITNNATLTTAGYKVFVAGKLTIDSGSKLCDDGTAGGAGSGGTGGAAGVSLDAGLYSPAYGTGDGTAGQTAGVSGISNGSSGVVTISFLTAALSNQLPITWRMGGGGTGGAAHGFSTGSNLDSLATTQALAITYPGGRGGNATGTNNVALGGGGGGGGGGSLWLAVKEIDNGGTISANGGAGGNGQTSSSSTSGNGGGGGGGTYVIYYKTASGSGLGTRQTLGGAAGTGGNGGAGGTDGSGFTYQLGV